MAIFSSGEADGSSIIEATKILSNGSFSKWEFTVQDANRNFYRWTDTTENLGESSAPTLTQISTYIKAYLIGTGSYSGVEKVTTSPAKITFTTHADMHSVAPGAVPYSEATDDEQPQ